MKNKFHFFYCIAIYCCITLSHAQSTIGPVGSQQGGFEDYEINCPAGEFLVGLELRTGWYVDNIGLICASFDAAGNTIIETLDTNNDELFNDVDDEKVTGGGDITTTLACPNNSVINQLGGREEAYVDALGARCINTNNTDSTGLNITGGAGGSDFNLFCPSGQVVTGISGRSGWWIDSANFICEPLCLSAPAQVNLLSPQNGEGLSTAQSVSFSWSVPGAGFIIGQHFQMCISSDAANGCDIVEATTSQTSIEIDSSLITFNNSPLFWSVRAINNCGEPGPFTQANTLNPPGQGTVGVSPGIDYRPLCSVYKDERCSTCHGGPAPSGHPVAFPEYDDALARFEDDSCNGCHSVVHPDTNQNVWEFPPGAADEVIGVDLQTFADPATCGDICRSVRNWAEQHDFIHHIEVDPLVRYGFEPDIIQGSAAGTLSARPPVEAMTHGEYINLSTSWYRNGMPCDPINNNFPSGTVSAAGNSNDGTDDNANNADNFDPEVLDKVVNVPAVTELLWWIDGSKEKLKSNRPTNTGKLPAECLELIKQPGRPIPIRSLQSRLRDQNLEVLKKECKKIMAAQR